MPLSTFDIQLEKLAYGGDAMGRLPDGRAVFVPFGLPGERVRIRLTEEKKNFARGELVEVLKPRQIESSRSAHILDCAAAVTTRISPTKNNLRPRPKSCATS